MKMVWEDPVVNFHNFSEHFNVTIELRTLFIKVKFQTETCDFKYNFNMIKNVLKLN